MIGQGDKVIAMLMVSVTDLLRRQRSIRSIRVGVQIASIKQPRFLEHVSHRRFFSWFMMIAMLCFKFLNLLPPWYRIFHSLIYWYTAVVPDVRI